MKEPPTRDLATLLADYGYAMGCLVQQQLAQTGREDEIRALMNQGFQFLFTFAPERDSAGDCGEVGAALFHPATRETVPILRFALTGSRETDHRPRH